jgi:hypothetical protein
MKLASLIVPSLLLSLFLHGCGAGYRKEGPDVGSTAYLHHDVTVEAYLFDAKLRRHKKPTSVRLEFYHTDSVIAVAGRAYLGKGALRGRLTADSLIVYFPTTDEYVIESVADLLGSLECSAPLPDMSLLELFANLPDSVLTEKGFKIVSDTSDRLHPGYELSFEGCRWNIRLTYALQREGWRVKEFAFDDGAGVTLKGKRRTYKREATVKAGKFKVPIKAGSTRIIL